MRRTTILISFLVFLSVSSVALAAPGKRQKGGNLPSTSAPPTNPIDVRAQYGTTAQAVASAVSTANTYGVGLYFSGGSAYSYSQTIVLNSITAYGDGATSVLTATDPAQMAFRLVGTGSAVKNLKITAPTASTRLGTGESTGVFVDHATTATVSGVTIDKAGSAGILTWHSSGVTITGNNVRNTLADGIHTTGCSYNVTVTGNTVYNSGDDMYAVVSYLSDGCRTHDVTISNNVGDVQPWGRGITVVGGYNVTISGNQISHTYGAGIHVAAGNSEYNVDNVTINNNTLRYVAQVIHNVNILLYAPDSTYPIRSVTGSGNSRDTSKPCTTYDGAVDSSSVTCT